MTAAATDLATPGDTQYRIMTRIILLRTRETAFAPLRLPQPAAGSFKPP